jgi:hypothetical protein
VIRAPPALDLASLPEDAPSTAQLRIVCAIIESGWPALLAALSFIIATNLSDDLFVEVLASYQAMTNVAGMLGLTTPRDAFFTSLAKFAVPTRVVSSLDHSYGTEAQTPRSAASISENLGFSTGPAQPASLSERNLACLKVLVASALFLAGSLGESWFGILEALQNADYVLTSKGAGAGAKRAPGSRAVSGSSTGTRHALLSDLEPEALQVAIQSLFDASKNLEDDAFRHFINALCRLSAEMVGMQTDGESILDTSERNSLDDTATLSPKIEPAHRRRVSGIHIPRTLVNIRFLSLSFRQLMTLFFSVPEILGLTSSEGLPFLIFTASYIAPRMSPGILLLTIYSPLSVSSTPRNLSASRPPGSSMRSSLSFPETLRLPASCRPRCRNASSTSLHSK